MAIVSITLTLDTTAAPNATTHLIALAQEWMAVQIPPVDFSGMNSQTKVKTWLRGYAMEQVKQRQLTASTVTAKSTIDAAVASIATETNTGLT